MIIFGIKYAFFHTLVLQINGNYYQNEHTKVVHLACFDAMEWVFEHLNYISFDVLYMLKNIFTNYTGETQIKSVLYNEIIYVLWTHSRNTDDF